VVVQPFYVSEGTKVAVVEHSPVLIELAEDRFQVLSEGEQTKNIDVVDPFKVEPAAQKPNEATGSQARDSAYIAEPRSHFVVKRPTTETIDDVVDYHTTLAGPEPIANQGSKPTRGLRVLIASNKIAQVLARVPTHGGVTL